VHHYKNTQILHAGNVTVNLGYPRFTVTLTVERAGISTLRTDRLELPSEALLHGSR
jgi:hypothetical protein